MNPILRCRGPKSDFYPYKADYFYGAYNKSCDSIRMAVLSLRIKTQESLFVPYPTMVYSFFTPHDRMKGNPRPALRQTGLAENLVLSDMVPDFQS